MAQQREELMHKKLTRRQAIKIIFGTLLFCFILFLFYFARIAIRSAQGDKVVFGYGVASGDPDQIKAV
jgi:phosphodiesterase/alkaline phosphatase D-like protein